MIEFLQGYGILIAFGMLFLFMIRSHGHGGGGCGMGGHQPSRQEQGGEPGVDGTSEGDHKKHGCH